MLGSEHSQRWKLQLAASDITQVSGDDRFGLRGDGQFDEMVVCLVGQVGPPGVVSETSIVWRRRPGVTIRRSFTYEARSCSIAATIARTWFGVEPQQPPMKRAPAFKSCGTASA